jgi:hypothetical protein
MLKAVLLWLKDAHTGLGAMHTFMPKHADWFVIACQASEMLYVLEKSYSTA